MTDSTLPEIAEAVAEASHYLESEVRGGAVLVFIPCNDLRRHLAVHFWGSRPGDPSYKLGRDVVLCEVPDAVQTVHQAAQAMARELGG